MTVKIPLGNFLFKNFRVIFSVIRLVLTHWVENVGLCLEVSRQTLWVEIPGIKRMHESLNQTHSPFYWILSLCIGVGQVFKNKSTHQFQEHLKNE